MLTERKRFNYMVTTTHSSHASHSQKKQFPVSSLNNIPSTPRQENIPALGIHQNKENTKKIQELQSVNKRLLDQTTKQFKKLESDVQRVEKILEEKEEMIADLKRQTSELSTSVSKTTDEKQILIQAIFQKDLVIKQYENRIQQLMHHQTFSVPEEITEQKITIQTVNMQSQTEPETEKCTKTQLSQAVKQAVYMQDEVYRLKEQLYDAHNKIKLMAQQFEAYKILKQIESVQQI